MYTLETLFDSIVALFITGTVFYILGILYLVFVTNRHMLPLIGKGEERKGEKAACAESEEA